MQGADDSSTPERGSGKRVFLPSSMGVSILGGRKRPSNSTSRCRGATTRPIPRALTKELRPAKKSRMTTRPRQVAAATSPGTGNRAPNVCRSIFPLWTSGSRNRSPCQTVEASRSSAWSARLMLTTVEGVEDARAVALFVVNRRQPTMDDDLQDTAFAFQVEMSVEADRAPCSKVRPARARERRLGRAACRSALPRCRGLRGRP